MSRITAIFALTLALLVGGSVGVSALDNNTIFERYEACNDRVNAAQDLMLEDINNELWETALLQADVVKTEMHNCLVELTSFTPDDEFAACTQVYLAYGMMADMLLIDHLLHRPENGPRVLEPNLNHETVSMFPITACFDG